MGSFYSFSYQVGRLPACAIKTGTHRFCTCVFGVAEWKATSIPTKFFVSNPPLFPSGWSYPYPTFSTSVHNRQAPLCFQLQNVAVRNRFSPKRINNLNYIFFQHQFRFNPNQVDKQPQSQATYQLKRNLSKALSDQKTIHNEQSNQYERAARPNIITSGSKSLVHDLSIAGATQ